MKNIRGLTFFFLFLAAAIIVSPALGLQDTIFNYPDVIENIDFPINSHVLCKFSQKKTMKNSTAEIKSSGDFEFDINKGVTFNTTYPVKQTTTYEDKSYINGIIISIAKKDYSYIKKNFNVYYLEGGTSKIALTPKKNSKLYDVLSSIKIEGKNYINKIEIGTTKGADTEIDFNGCRKE